MNFTEQQQALIDIFCDGLNRIFEQAITNTFPPTATKKPAAPKIARVKSAALSTANLTAEAAGDDLTDDRVYAELSAVGSSLMDLRFLLDITTKNTKKYNQLRRRLRSLRANKRIELVDGIYRSTSNFVAMAV